MEPQSATVSLPWSHAQHAPVSTTLGISDVSDSATMNSTLLYYANSADLAASASKPAVISSDSGIFMERSSSTSEQTGDAQASRSSSAQSVDRTDSCIDRPNSAVRCLSSSADRPASALTRGVQIVEYPRWNPKPLASLNEESLVLMEEYLCPRKLVRTLFILYSRFIYCLLTLV